jgi:hypothetical protein
MAPNAVTAPIHFEHQSQRVEGEVRIEATDCRLLSKRDVQCHEQGREAHFVLTDPKTACLSRSGATLHRLLREDRGLPSAGMFNESGPLWVLPQEQLSRFPVLTPRQSKTSPCPIESRPLDADALGDPHSALARQVAGMKRPVVDVSFLTAPRHADIVPDCRVN